MKNIFSKFSKILFLCTLLNCTGFNNAYSVENYSDLYPVCEKLGQALARTKVGRWLRNLLKTSVIIPAKFNPSNQILTITDQNNNHTETSQELTKDSSMLQVYFDRWKHAPSELDSNTIETKISLNNPENFNIDIKNLRTIFKIELAFFKLQQQGISENNIIKYLAHTIKFNQKQSEDLITLADYLQFRNILKIFAKQVLYKLSKTGKQTPEIDNLFSIGSFKLNITEEFNRNINFYSGPKLRNSIQQELYIESIFHNPLRINKFAIKWLYGLAIRVFFPALINSDSLFKILNPFSITFAFLANILTDFNPYLTAQEKEVYFNYILGIFTGLTLIAEPICFDWFIYTPIKRIIQGIKNHRAYYRQHQEQ